MLLPRMFRAAACSGSALQHLAPAATNLKTTGFASQIQQQQHVALQQLQSRLLSERAYAVEQQAQQQAQLFKQDATGRIQAHGSGPLINRLVTDPEQRRALEASCTHTQECTDRNACDMELLTVGAFTPLTGFMNQDVYEHVLTDMRLPESKLLFGLPVIFDTNDETIREGSRVLLQYQGQKLGVLEVESKWEPNKPKETRLAYGTSSLEHPGVQMVAWERGRYYLGGRVWGLELPKRVFPCATPQEVRAMLPPGNDVVVFQCRNPVHRAHYELFTRALHAPNVRHESVVLVHPTCGPTQCDDIPGIVRYHTYEVLKQELNNPRILWAYLPYAMHMAGPREAIQHMIIRKNYGCSHFIVGRDMAGSKSCVTGDDFYGMYDAQTFAQKHAAELGMQIVPSLDVVYTEEAGYVTADMAKARNLHIKQLSGTKFRQLLRSGAEIPEWFAFRSVVQVLRQHAQSSLPVVQAVSGVRAVKQPAVASA